MLALITGASNGIGKDFAKELSKQGYDLVLVARSKEKLEKLSRELKTLVYIEVMDLSVRENVYKLYNKYQGKIDLLINNAGFGAFGKFIKTDLENELNMIDLNVTTYHILTKLFLQDFVKKDKGEILNVASSAAFEPGPLMSTYYATKSYVYQLTEALYYEEKKKKTKVHVSVLCPGPVETNFNNVAKVKFSVKPLKSAFVARYAIDKTLENKMLIIPGFKMKCAKFFSRFVSDKFLLRIIYRIQKKKAS